MFNFGIVYSLKTLTEDASLVHEHVEKEKVIIRGETKTNSFYAIYSYVRTVEGMDWYQLMQHQQVRLQE